MTDANSQHDHASHTGHDMATMDHGLHDKMSELNDHAQHGMAQLAEVAANTDFDYLLAFTAGLLGSGHCLGMCGALVSGYFMKAGSGHRWLPHLAYQLTRISTYAVKIGRAHV